MTEAKFLSKKAKTRERIFNVAMELFLRQGYESTTVEQIVTEADVAKGTFFNHFPTKDAILSDLGRQRMEVAESRMVKELCSVDSSREKILLLFRVFGETNEESREITALVTREIVGKAFSGVEQEKENIRQFQIMFLNLILEGQKNGEFLPTDDAEKVSDILLAMYLFTLMQWVSGELSGSLTEELTNKSAIILNGLKN